MGKSLIDEYKILLENSSALIALVDLNGLFQFASPSSEAILGYNPEQLTNENAFEYIHPDDREQIRDSFEALAQSENGTKEREEYRFRHADGHWVWLESVTTNKTGTAVEGFVISSRDISHRKNLEQELANERDRYSTVIDSSHDGIFIVQNGEFVFANPRCLHILRYEESEFLGKYFLDVVAPKDRDLVRERYERRLDSASESPPQRYEVHFLTKDGEERVAEISASKISYDGVPGTLVIFRDVTKRTRYEKRLEETTEELEALNRVVRHDIRNDMNILLAWTQMLEDHVDDEGQEYLKKILASGNTIVELTEVARDFVESLTSETETEVKPTALKPILETEIALRRESHPQAEIIGPNTIPDVEVWANELLGSLFRNILNNAIQHNHSDQPVVQITCEESEKEVIVSVADNGPGIPDEQKKSIFGKGEKGVDSPGTGIGLYLVQTLIDQYDGRVQVEDNDPTGTIFNIRLLKTD
jgi:PAS domain S-box-containing protein